MIIMKGKLKKVRTEWHKYLEGKTLVLSSAPNNTFALWFIEGEEDLDELCVYAWEKGITCGLTNVESFKSEVSLGNEGFGFHECEIEIIDGTSKQF